MNKFQVIASEMESTGFQMLPKDIVANCEFEESLRDSSNPVKNQIKKEEDSNG